MGFDKRDVCLAKDVLHFVREKVNNRDNCVFDVLIASIWLTFHSLDGNLSGPHLKDLIVLDKQIQTLNSDSVYENNSTETKNKIVDEIVNTGQQDDKNKILYNEDAGRNFDENSEDKIGGLKDKKPESSFHKQDIQDNFRPGVQQLNVAKEANEKKGEIVSVDTDDDDDVIIIENDVVTIQIDDDFDEDTGKNKESVDKHDIIELNDLPFYSVEGNESADSNKAEGLMYDEEHEHTENKNNAYNKCIDRRESNGASGLKITNVRGSLKLSECSVDIIRDSEQIQDCQDDIVVSDVADNEFLGQEPSENEEQQDIYRSKRSNSRSLQLTPEADHKIVATEKPTDQAKPIMIMSNIFNRETQSSQWCEGDNFVVTPQNYEILLENDADESLYYSENTQFEPASHYSDQMCISQDNLCFTLSTDVPTTSSFSYPRFSFLTGATYLPSGQNSRNIENRRGEYVLSGNDMVQGEPSNSTDMKQTSLLIDGPKSKKVKVIHPFKCPLSVTGNHSVKGVKYVRGYQSVKGNHSVKGNQSVKLKGNKSVKGNQTEKINGNKSVELKGKQSVKGNLHVKGIQSKSRNLLTKKSYSVKTTQSTNKSQNTKGSCIKDRGVTAMSYVGKAKVVKKTMFIKEENLKSSKNAKLEEEKTRLTRLRSLRQYDFKSLDKTNTEDIKDVKQAYKATKMKKQCLRKR
ncbi:uncharacterized protein LOC132724667 [Ruditapes philippinarum]|uniref:uncharacterized protein LOC132724667 n=1 Tax=Ruditapes philippinarum TaxID=129788 RepID=UPI00295A9F8C|nr:uncharacterized protein LOC132724667 [Ruditapes philippinarum]